MTAFTRETASRKWRHFRSLQMTSLWPITSDLVQLKHRICYCCATKTNAPDYFVAVCTHSIFFRLTTISAWIYRQRSRCRLCAACCWPHPLLPRIALVKRTEIIMKKTEQNKIKVYIFVTNVLPSYTTKVLYGNRTIICQNISKFSQNLAQKLHSTSNEYQRQSLYADWLRWIKKIRHAKNWNNFLKFETI